MGKWTLERWVMVAMLLIQLGMNWQQAKGQQEQINRIEKSQAEYVRQDVYDEQRLQLTDAINRLTKQLEKFYELERETMEPSRVQRQRMFDK
jgi:hypothetical protein